MRHLFILLATVLFCTESFYTQSFNESVFKETTVKNRFSLIEEVSIKKVVIPFKYNSAVTEIEKNLFLKLPYRNIQKIEYVYSSNKDVLHQNKLNNDRLDSLNQLFKNRLIRVYKHIELQTIIQTCQEDKRELFNGFIISFEKNSRSNNKLFEKIISSESSKKKKNESCFNLDTLSDYGYVLPHIKSDYSRYEYKTVSSVFSRNKEWKDKLIIVDVTGSMTPYIAQYLLWLKLTFNEKEKQNYVFFNDGNGFKRRVKRIGSTGGMYYTGNNLGYQHIINTISKAIINGNCNYEVLENDIEAVLGGINKYPDSKNIVLIADNNAPPRDIALIKKLKVPVKVILCGTNNQPINKDYLDLAYQTKGSIHTIEDDFKNIFEQKEGSVFEFFGTRYKIIQGKVTLAKDKSIQ